MILASKAEFAGVAFKPQVERCRAVERLHECIELGHEWE